jgi:hypothetical protein
MRIFRSFNLIRNTHGKMRILLGVSFRPEVVPLHPKDSNARSYYWIIWFWKWKCYGGFYSRWLFKYWKGCRLLWTDKNYKPRNLWLEEDDQ